MSSPYGIPLRLLPAGVLLLLLLAMAQSPLRLAPDCGVYVESGQLLLEGKRPYVDFIEINPPMIIYLNAVPALFAELAGVHPVIAFNGFVFLLIAWSTWECRRQLARADLDWIGLTPDLTAAGLAALSLGLWFTEPWAINDFAQREHLFALLWMPYAILRARRDADTAIHPLPAALLGALAGIGANIKPYFLVTALVAELGLLLTRRSLRSLLASESIAFAAVTALYVIHFALLPHDVRAAFFGIWLPLLARFYGAYARRNAMALQPRLIAAFAIGLLAWLLAQLPRLHSARLGRLYACLGAFTIAAVGQYYWQAKGFFYHEIPALFGGLALAAVLVAQALALLLGRGPRGFLRPALQLAFAAVGGWLVVAVSPTALRASDGNGALPGFGRLVAAYADEGEPIVIFSTSVWPEYPTLAQLRRHQGVRFASLVYLSVAMSARAHDGGESEKLILDMLAEDLRRNAPPIIVVANRRCGKCAGLTLLAHLQAHPGIGEVMRGYQPARGPFGLPAGSIAFVRADRAARGPAPGTAPPSPLGRGRWAR